MRESDKFLRTTGPGRPYLCRTGFLRTRSRETFSFLRRDGFLELSIFGQNLFPLDLFAGGGAFEGLHFALAEFAEGPGGDVEREGSVADAAYLFNVMADLFEHLAKLAVTAFGERDFEPGVVAAADALDFCGLGEDAVASPCPDFVEASAIDHDAAPQLLDDFGRG